MTDFSTPPGASPHSGFSIDFDPRCRVLRISPFGVLRNETVSTADAAVRQFLADEGADFGIFDYSAVTEIRVTSTYVQSFATKDPAHPPMKLRVAVAPQTVAYGLSRMYGLLIEGKRSDYQVVRTLKEAEELIGLGTLDFTRKLR